MAKLAPGPGHYQPPISSINPIYKNNKSSVFASAVPRNASSANGKRHKVVPASKKTPNTASKYQAIASAASPNKGPAGVQDLLESDDDEQ